MTTHNTTYIRCKLESMDGKGNTIFYGVVSDYAIVKNIIMVKGKPYQILQVNAPK